MIMDGAARSAPDAGLVKALRKLLGIVEEDHGLTRLNGTGMAIDAAKIALARTAAAAKETP
jgi:hypothetical protein